MEWLGKPFKRTSKSSCLKCGYDDWSSSNHLETLRMDARIRNGKAER